MKVLLSYERKFFFKRKQIFITQKNENNSQVFPCYSKSVKYVKCKGFPVAYYDIKDLYQLYQLFLTHYFNFIKVII